MSILFGERDEDSDYEKEERGSEKKQGDSKLILAVLGLLFAPILIPTLILSSVEFRYFVQKLKLHPTTIAGICLGLTGISALIFFLSGSSETLKDFFGGNFNGWKEALIALIFPVALIDVFLSSLLTIAATINTAWSFRRRPYLTELNNDWRHNFKFRRSLFQWMKYKRTEKKLKQGECDTSDAVAVGMTVDSDEVVYRGRDEIILQSLVTGGTGSGKSGTLSTLALYHIDSRDPTIFINFKDDPNLTRKLIKWAALNGAPFFHVTGGSREDYAFKKIHPKGPAYFNPFGNNPDDLVDILTGLRDYDTNAAVYEQETRRIVTILSKALHYVKKDETTDIDWYHGLFRTLLTLTEGDNIVQFSEACIGTPYETEILQLAEAITGKRRSITSDQYNEIRGSLSLIALSSWGEWMIDGGDGENSVDLVKLTHPDATPPVILFSLNADSEEKFSNFMGSIVFKLIQNLSAHRRGPEYDNLIAIFADEFQGVPVSAVEGLLSKGRSSRMAVTLSAQNLSQIEISGGSSGKASVQNILNNCSNFIVHKGSNRETANMYSQLLSTKEVQRYRSTARTDNFLFSFNFFNQRENIVATDTVTKDICPPELIQSLYGASTHPDNVTAVFIKKEVSSGESSKGERSNGEAIHTRVVAPVEAINKETNESVYAALIESPVAKHLLEEEKEEAKNAVEIEVPLTEEEKVRNGSSSSEELKTKQPPKLEQSSKIEPKSVRSKKEKEEFAWEENPVEVKESPEDLRRKEIDRKIDEKKTSFRKASSSEAVLEKKNHVLQKKIQKVNPLEESSLEKRKPKTLKEIKQKEKEKQNKAKENGSSSAKISMPDLDF